MAVALAVVASACTADLESGPATSDSGLEAEPAGSAADATMCDDATDTALDQWAAVGFSGSVAFATAGTFDCRGGYGLADRDGGEAITADTVFSIGSITKTFTAAAILGLVDDGVLALDDRVGDVLPAVEGPIAEATVEHLLTHAGGLRGSHGRDHEPLDAAAALDAIGQLEVVFQPGTETLYSNAGYTLLALIVETVSGATSREWMVERVLTLPSGERIGGFWDGEPSAPGPKAVGYFDDGSAGVSGQFAGPHWGLDGNGGLAMTTGDLARWAQALLAGEIISPESLAIMTDPAFDLGDGTAEAMGWVVLDETVFGSPALATSGGGGAIGHQMAMVVFPDDDQIFVVSSNGPEFGAEQLLQSLLPQLIAGESIPTPPSVTPVEAGVVEELAGTYELGADAALDVGPGGEWVEIGATGPAAIAALFPPPPFLDESAVSDHEQLVTEFLAGATEEGRAELALLEADFGQVEEVRIDGTVYRGELRTFVTVITESESIPAWIALDDRGGLAAAEIFPAPPSVRFGSVDGAGYQPIDLDGTDPDVMVSFDGATMTVVGPDGSVSASRQP